MTQPMHEFGLRILAEIPTYLSARIAKHRETDTSTPADKLAEAVVADLNEGQRWTLAVAAVAANITAYDRAYVRGVEKAAVRRRTPRRPDAATLELVRAEVSEVRKLAEQAATEIVVNLTAELLDAPVRLGDGTEVLIGDATLEQHQARVDMLDRHAQGAADSLARAIALLNLLKSSGRARLRDVR